jgi:hypothetical protein
MSAGKLWEVNELRKLVTKLEAEVARLNELKGALEIALNTQCEEATKAEAEVARLRAVLTRVDSKPLSEMSWDELQNVYPRE